MKMTTFLIALGFLQTQAQELTDSRQKEIVFRSVNVIPMDRERILENQDVVVRNGVITAMGGTGKVKYAKNALLISARGKYLIPGLAEMHAHVPQTDDFEPMKEVLTLFITNGVTTVRGMLGHPRHLELRKKIQSGEIMGPTFYTSGPSLNGNSIPTAEIAVRTVRVQKAAGYDFLKIHPGILLPNFDAIVKTAREEKIYFAGHVPADVGIWHAIECDYRSIDHLDGMIEGLVPDLKSLPEDQVGLFGVFCAAKADVSKLPEMLKGLHDHHTWVVPTQSLADRWLAFDKTSKELSEAPEMQYMTAKIRQDWINAHENILKQSTPDGFKAFSELRKKLIYECQKSGVGILLGSDAPQIFNVPGFSVHHELHYYVDAGLTPFEALQTGTVNVAGYFNRPNTGTIKSGNVSDLVLLNGNPLKEIDQTQNIEGVMLGNQWLSKDYLAAEQKKLVKQ